MRKLILLTLWLGLGTAATATGDSLSYLTPKDTIFLTVGQFQEKYFTHYVEYNQTLFSLAKFYGMSLEELYFHNPGLNQRVVKLGMPINIPVPNRAIKRYWSSDMVPGDYVPVYYVVRKGDTMFRIAKRYFQMPIEEMLQRNRLFDHTLHKGQELHVGWMSIEGIPDSLRQYKGGALGKRNAELRKIFERGCGGQTPELGKGAAACPDNENGRTDLYALHRKAPLNSVVAIRNPMSRRTVYAKVIGRIPETQYENEVAVVVSALAAQLLAAIDSRFFVEVKYCP
jgi:LysM repeat protein